MSAVLPRLGNCSRFVPLFWALSLATAAAQTSVVCRIEYEAAAPSNQIVLRWQGATNHAYDVLACSDLGNSWELLNPFPLEVGTNDSMLLFRDRADQPRRFYQVVDLTSNYWVRLDFEDIRDLASPVAPWLVLSNHYLAYGAYFVPSRVGSLHPDSLTPCFEPVLNPSYVLYQSDPFCPECLNWPFFTPFQLAMIGVNPCGNNFTNICIINFTKPASQVHFWCSSGQAGPTTAYPKIRLYDGPNGTGNQLALFQNIPKTNQQYVEFITNAYVFKSMTINSSPDRFGMDNLTFNSGTRPKGGHIQVASDQDVGIMSPQVFLNGSPSYLGEPRGRSPVSMISLSEGYHLVRVYLPGYEWHSEYVHLAAAQTIVVQASLHPVRVPAFGTNLVVETLGVAIDVGENATSSLADYDKDGRHDLVVGAADGAVYGFRNIGSDHAPMFSNAVPLLSAVASNAAPVLIDFYTDEKDDLVVGYADGSVRLFYNQGTRTAPSYGGSPYDATIAVIPASNAVPSFVDWNNDGKKDLLVGGADGNVYVFLNIKLEAYPAYDAAPSLIACSVSSNAAPAAVLDWDADGRKDLVVGDNTGRLQLFLNQGTDAAPSFGTAAPMTNTLGSELSVGARACPVVVDINGDQIKDILVGNGEGRVQLYRGMTGASPRGIR